MPRARNTGKRLIKLKRTRKVEVTIVKCPHCGKSVKVNKPRKMRKR